MGKGVLNMVRELTFTILTKSRIFNRVGNVYRGLTEIIFVEQYVSFSAERSGYCAD
jgi:hypothetical protein